MKFVFGNFEFDDRTRELTESGAQISVEPQVFEVIQHLIENREKIVSKDELVDAVWDGRAVSDATITSRINFARKVLGDDGKAQSVIRTYPRKGFRFVAEGKELGSAVVDETDQIANRPAIAVLPFSNLSARPEDEIIGEGICEDLTVALSAVRLYRIIARSSTSKYRENVPDLAGISSELDAAFLITGNYRRAGDKLRVSVQLDDAKRGSQVWARRFDGDYQDLFGIQDEVVAALIGQLEPELDELSYRRNQIANEGRLSSWELYHRAMMLVAERKTESTILARDYFQRAVEIDPGFSRAHAGLAQVYMHMAVATGEDTYGLELLKTARLAVAADSRDYMAQTALGIAHTIRREHASALRAHQKAIEFNPHNAQTRAWHALALSACGQAERAIPQLELAIKLSPSDPWIGPFYGRLSRAHYFLGNIG